MHDVQDPDDWYTGACPHTFRFVHWEKKAISLRQVHPTPVAIAGVIVVYTPFSIFFLLPFASSTCLLISRLFSSLLPSSLVEPTVRWASRHAFLLCEECLPACDTGF